VPFPGSVADLDRAAERANACHGDVDAHAASRNTGHRLGVENPEGAGEHAQQLVVRQRLGVRPDDALALRLLENLARSIPRPSSKC